LAEIENRSLAFFAICYGRGAPELAKLRMRGIDSHLWSVGDDPKELQRHRTAELAKRQQNWLRLRTIAPATAVTSAGVLAA
jgi:hypothetical protein